MPVQIGAKTHSFTDPTGLLSDCHRRIEMFIGSLGAVGNRLESPPDAETRQALETALRYFHEAAPKHTADEEESLFPRLRRLQSNEVHQAFSKLDDLEGEHRWAEPLHARVESLGLRYLADGALAPSGVEEFRRSVAELSAMYKRHIAVEDSMLFPVASQALSESDKQAIAKEMARRREAPLVNPT